MSKTAIVSGAGSGVGQAVALQLAREGWNVGLLGRRMEPLQQTIRLADELGTRMLAVPCDVADTKQLKQAIDRAAAAFGRIDCLINNAGWHPPATTIDETRSVRSRDQFVASRSGRPWSSAATPSAAKANGSA